MKIRIRLNAVSAKKGIVTKPNQLMYWTLSRHMALLPQSWKPFGQGNDAKRPNYQ